MWWMRKLPPREVLKSNPDKLDEAVFRVLGRKGPLCPSRISTELDLYLSNDLIIDSLNRLKEKRIVKQGHEKEFPEILQPWDLRIF